MLILAIFLYLYSISSIIAFISLLVKYPKVFIAEEHQWPWFFLPVSLGVLVTLFYVLFFGFKHYLIFIPSSWENGDWLTVRDSIAVALALATTCHFFNLIFRVQKKEGVIQQLKRRNRIKAQMLNRFWDRFSPEEKHLIQDDSSEWPQELEDKITDLLNG